MGNWGVYTVPYLSTGPPSNRGNIWVPQNGIWTWIWGLKNEMLGFNGQISTLIPNLTGKEPTCGQENFLKSKQMETALCTARLYAKIHPEVIFKFVLVREGALTPASHCWRKNPVLCSWPAPDVLTTAHWIREEGPRVWIFWFLRLRWYHLRICWELSA